MAKKKSKKRSERKDTPRNGQDSVADLVNLVLIVALVGLFFLDVILRGQVFFAGDVMNVYSPWQMYNHEALASGRIPLWSDDLFGGFPLFAESQGALFYLPTRLVYLLVPIANAFSFDVLLHFVMAGWFQYFLARTLKLAPSASLLAAVAFAFSGMFLSLPINFTIFRSIVWIPLIFTFVTIGARSGSLFYPLLTALAMVLQMMGGSLQVTGITVLALIPYSIFLVFSPGNEKKPTLLPFFQLILTLMLAVGLYAFQLFPTLELSSEAWRGTQAGYDVASSFSFPPIHFIDVLFPTIFGRWLDGTLLPVVPTTANFFPYIGLAPLLLIPLGLVSKKRGAIIMILLVALFILLALGKNGPLFPIVYSTVPMFDKFRAPDRFWCIAIFAGTLLAGFGLDRLLSDTEDEKPATSPAMMGAITLILLLATAFLAGAVFFPPAKPFWETAVNSLIGVFFNPSNPPFDPAIFERWRDHLAIVFLHGTAAVALFTLAIWLLTKKSLAPVLAFSMVLITVADLYMMSLNVPAIRTTTKEFFTSPPRTAQVLLRDGEPNRFYTYGKRAYAQDIFKFPAQFDDTIWYNGGGSNDVGAYFKFREELSPNIFMHWGLQSSNGFASLFLERYFNLEGAANSQLLPLLDIDRQAILAQNPPGVDVPVSEWANKTLLVDLMASRYVLSPVKFAPTDRFGLLYEDPNPENGQEHVYINRKALPRAWIAMPQSILAETPETLTRLGRAEVDPTNSLILDPLPPSPRLFPNGPMSDATARIKSGGAARGGELVDEQVYIDTYSPQPAYLFLADTYYAPQPDIPFFAKGFFSQWRAEIDGQRVDTIYRAFGYFRAIEIPAGEHTVRFYYQPMSFYAGVILSGVILIVALLLIIVQAVVFNRLKHRDEDDED